MNFCDFPISNSKGVCHRQITKEYENSGITKFFLKDLIKESSLKNNDSISNNQIKNDENNFQQNDKNQSFNVSYTWETDTISGLRFINVLNKKDKKKLGFQCIYCRDKQLFKKKSSVLYHMVTFNHGLKTSVIEELKIERNLDDRLDFIKNFNLEKPTTEKKENEIQKEFVNDYNLIKLEIEFVSTLNLLTHEELKTLFLLFFPENLLSINQYMSKENIIEIFLLNISSISEKYSGTIKKIYNAPILNKDVDHISLSEYLNELKGTVKGESNLKYDTNIKNKEVINELMSFKNKIYEEIDTYEEDKKNVSETKNENNIKDTREKNKEEIIENNIKEITEQNKNNIIQENENNIIEENKNNIIQENENNITEESKNNIIQENENIIIEENKNNIIQENESKNDITQKNKNNAIEENKNNIIRENENNIIQENEENKREIIKSTEKNHIIINIKNYDIFKHNDKLFIDLTTHKETKDNIQNTEDTFLIINNSLTNNEVNNIEVKPTNNSLLKNINTQRINNNDQKKENSIGVLLNMNKKIRKNRKINENGKKYTTNICKKSRKNEKNSLHEKLKINSLCIENSVQENCIKESLTNEKSMINNLIEDNLDKENNNLNKKKYNLENYKKSYYAEKSSNLINNCLNSVDVEKNNNTEDDLHTYNDLFYIRNNEKNNNVNYNKSIIENNHINNESSVKISEVNNENNLNLNNVNTKNTNNTFIRKINYEKKNNNNNNNNKLVNQRKGNCIISVKEIKKKIMISNKTLKKNKKQKVEYDILLRRNVKSTYSRKFLEEKKIMNIKKKHTKKTVKDKKPTYVNYEKNICKFIGKKKNLLIRKATNKEHRKKFMNKTKKKKIENICTFLNKEIKQLCNLSKENIIQHDNVNLMCTRSHRLSRYIKK
ncbi:conserved Plasmodium protein, unknown function [Plasmodium gallinaceum]|uniref:Uncharacterized protein n=1 Tax=Plasmodium gallinaceum TaxID=5849 RepID=A0A1J1GWM2_PLAGA|nr:LOW QUALITY PROTEIN: conserved Plasmodium protein, unknown function [Plasmodium gallinaceum]CRG96947.1 conserved Plasmodium protein, unknown function [Plasmodium gallinaceum]